MLGPRHPFPSVEWTIGIAPILRKLEGFGSAEISEGVEKTANLPPPLRAERPDGTRLSGADTAVDLTAAHSAIQRHCTDHPVVYDHAWTLECRPADHPMSFHE